MTDFGGLNFAGDRFTKPEGPKACYVIARGDSDSEFDLKKIMAVKLSVINFKGGVGKTTLAFHLAAHLAQKSKVLIIDVDHQSSLSLVMLGGKLWEDAAKARKTCNTIFESFCNRKVSMPGDEIVFKNPLHERDPRYDFYQIGSRPRTIRIGRH
jgi:hypothetical protein